MKTLLLTILIAALTAFVVGGKTETPPIKPDALERIKQTGVLRCGYIEYSHFLRKDPNTGSITGILPDMMNTLAAQSGLKIEWAHETTWATALTDLNQGRYDVFCSALWANSARAREALFSNAIAYASIQLYESFHKPQSRDSYVAIDGTYEVSLIERSLGQKPITLPAITSFGELMQSVAMGKYGRVLLEPSIVADYNRNNPKHTLQLAPDNASFKIPLILATALGEQNLRDFLNSALLEMRTTGAADAIWRKYNTDPKTPVYLKP